MDQKKTLFLQLMALLLFFSCLLYLAGNYAVMNHGAATTEGENKDLDGEMFMEEEEFVERRMEFESLDYPGSGANSRHDPWNSGRPRD
ncbi:hypothetical protein M5K25_003162 [Dendrobium thyrsiflorum]|uniref:Uncharacterized protein n=1 Tax=Dendrobium thyrsiflorum TaxID=117978 RepID=A0ABD0VYL4_DENTH